MIKVLVAGVGGPTPRSFVRAVKLFGKELAQRFEFIGVDCNPLAYGLYDKELFAKSFVIPRADNFNYWTVINKITEENEIDGAIILPELEVIEWAKNAELKLNKKIKLHLPDHALAKEIVNKHTLHKLLHDSGLIPKYYLINPSEYSYSELIKTVGEIFWVRSTEGSSGLGSLKIENIKALEQWIAINPAVGQFIASEFLPGRNMACKLLYFNGKMLKAACAERVNYIMAKVAPSGITGNTSFGRLLNEPGLIKISIDAIESIASKLGTSLNGIFTLDYKEDILGIPKITEINIRHVAFTSSLAAGGANLPLDTLKAMFLEDPKEMETTHYHFDEKQIFLRDVDGHPIVMQESDLLKMAL
jgi:carbamoyl-phosphate synthase large subunit